MQKSRITVDLEKRASFKREKDRYGGGELQLLPGWVVYVDSDEQMYAFPAGQVKGVRVEHYEEAPPILLVSD